MACTLVASISSLDGDELHALSPGRLGSVRSPGGTLTAWLGAWLGGRAPATSCWVPCR